MKEVPKILQDHRFRFIPLRERDKIPIEKSWQDKAQYRYDDPFLLSHIQKSGNIGIVCCKGQPLVIDFDEEEIEKKIAPLLPKTFTVRSGRGRLHKYYICSNAENMKILDKEKNTLCDIQADRKQVVIPPSIHPNGNEYYVIDNSEITNISMSEIKALFSDYISKDKIKTQIYSNDGASELKRSITFEMLLRDFGIDISKNPTMCPLGHHSDGQKCFHYDDTKQLAYCFHCEWGGDIISLTQEKDKCDFKKAMKLLSERYNIKISAQNLIEKTEKISAIEEYKLIPLKKIFVYRSGEETKYKFVINDFEITIALDKILNCIDFRMKYMSETSHLLPPLNIFSWNKLINDWLHEHQELSTLVDLENSNDLLIELILTEIQNFAVVSLPQDALSYRRVLFLKEEPDIIYVSNKVLEHIINKQKAKSTLTQLKILLSKYLKGDSKVFRIGKTTKRFTCFKKECLPDLEIPLENDNSAIN